VALTTARGPGLGAFSRRQRSGAQPATTAPVPAGPAVAPGPDGEPVTELLVTLPVGGRLVLDLMAPGPAGAAVTVQVRLVAGSTADTDCSADGTVPAAVGSLPRTVGDD
jgi:hypothetical protein